MSNVTFADVQAAKKRISSFINNTPVLESQLLNSWLGHKIFFKAECFQRTGAFKLRGALNMMLKAREEGRLGGQVVASSSGNHAQAVAYAAKILGVKATIYSAQHISKVKAAHNHQNTFSFFCFFISPHICNFVDVEELRNAICCFFFRNKIK